MKKLSWYGPGILIVVMTMAAGLAASGNHEGTANQDIRDRLVGAWRLAWIELEGTDGKPHRADRTGILVYTRDGHMSVQIMTPKGWVPPGGPVQYEQGGYEAYFGKYDVDEHAHSVTHHVEGALVRTLIGQDLTRVYEFSGRQLILKSSRSDEKWAVAWEHY